MQEEVSARSQPGLSRRPRRIVGSDCLFPILAGAGDASKMAAVHLLVTVGKKVLKEGCPATKLRTVLGAFDNHILQKPPFQRGDGQAYYPWLDKQIGATVQKGKDHDFVDK